MIVTAGAVPVNYNRYAYPKDLRNVTYIIGTKGIYTTYILFSFFPHKFFVNDVRQVR